MLLDSGKLSTKGDAVMLFFVTWVSYEHSRGFELHDQTTGFNTSGEAKREINRLYKDEQSAVCAYIVCFHNDGKQEFLCTALLHGAMENFCIKG